MRTFRIFLSSPGDCEAERAAAFTIIEQLNADPLITQFARLEVVAWDWGAGVPFDALASPQVSVNDRMPVPEACDVYIGIFRSRFGSPIPANEFRKDNGAPFLSGSEYEFDRAWKARRLGGKAPEVYVYRLRGPSPATSDAEQLRRLNTFFDSPPFRDQGQWVGSVNYFDDTAGFASQLAGHLRVILSKSHPRAKQSLRDWLESKAQRLQSDAGPRYTRESHVESDASSYFDWLLSRDCVVQEIDHKLCALWEEIQYPEFEPFLEEMRQLARELRECPFSCPNPTRIEQTQTGVYAAARRLERSIDIGSQHPSGLTIHRVRDIIAKVQDVLEANELNSTIAARRVLVVTGPAGQGKTHTLVHEVQSVLASGGIALGTLGQTLASGTDLRTALAQSWGYAEASFDEMLNAMEQAAAESGRRALIMIDALNETPNRTRWKNELNGLIVDILQRPHLTLALSVRSDYKAHVLPEVDPARPLWTELEHHGFSGIEPEAMEAYCAHYGVKAPVAPLIGELSNPLYVQLLVKSLVGRPSPSHWLPSWLDVWGAWISRLEADAQGRFALDPSRAKPVRRILNKIAGAMLEANKYELPRSIADEIARATAGNDELVGFLCSAGALMTRIDDDDEVVEFGFERLSDTFIADRLLNQLFENHSDQEPRREALRKAIAPGGKLSWLAVPGHDSVALSSRRAGLLTALCLAVPKTAGIELPSLIAEAQPRSKEEVLSDLQLCRAFVDSMRWRCAPFEFAGDRPALWAMYRRLGARLARNDDLDELIRLALIPGHPFAMERYLHPRLQRMHCVGARDAFWTIRLTDPWFEEGSNLSGVVRWAKVSDLSGIDAGLALVSARLLAWASASSQQQLRDDAIRGLARILVACPSVLSVILDEFLHVNDDYILESVLAATWGVLIHGGHRDACTQAAHQVQEAIFAPEVPHCHLTIRHYARRIIEVAAENGWITGIDLSTVRPPYRSSLPLNSLPTVDDLRAQSSSGGFYRILGSATDGDFYCYVMGGTSGGKPFSSQPLSSSAEPVRDFSSRRARPTQAPSGIFDIDLASRFVVWNCLRLGWTDARFSGYDTGPFTRSHVRIELPGITERIGKKYQWISWQTMLAFLTDNYQMTPSSGRQARIYDSPVQISYIELFDPSRWLAAPSKGAVNSLANDFWSIPSLPAWPPAEMDAIRRWGESDIGDLPAIDIINREPPVPAEWGSGPWISVVAEHVWKRPLVPGLWGLGMEQDVDIWLQLTPGLVLSKDLPALFQALEDPEQNRHFLGWGRIDLPSDWDARLAEWPGLQVDPEEHINFDRTDLPVNTLPLAGRCGNPDRQDEEGEIILPTPLLFQNWGLSLDLQHGVVRAGDQVIFGLMGRNALVARRDALMEILEQTQCSLVWWLRGERKAAIRRPGVPETEFPAWVDSYGMAYLAPDGRAHVTWLARDRRSASEPKNHSEVPISGS
ncbi:MULTISPECIES: ATP-binding protein [Pseudomonas]|uniref:ATP-binding protein n=1 Tax=Pseudomonas TaxID=286 RepID=UPI002361D7C6|nr:MULTISPECIES: ATP-binding protein [Pseudomonas]WJV25486.1 ATP-binding protein [Pseudomonas chlororaphis]